VITPVGEGWKRDGPGGTMWRVAGAEITVVGRRRRESMAKRYFIFCVRFGEMFVLSVYSDSCVLMVC
jgi:hypothetical protein